MFALLVCLAAVADDRPHVLVVLADDLGYGDVGFQGCDDIPTPHLDALAAAGVRMTAGYSSHPFCSPMRAGLLSGRYQQRFGYETNVAYDPGNERLGLPKSQRTIAARLQSVGYRTALFGKWHLGAASTFHPLNRGFDRFFGFLGGGHDYFTVDLTRPVAEGYRVPLCDDRGSAPLEGYLTDVLSERAAEWITQTTTTQPTFTLLAYNAPHTPLQAPEDELARFAHIEDKRRRTYAAMVARMDAGIGRVLAALEEAGQRERTLVVFLSDNGGPERSNASSNDPLRGEKGQVWEGGIRVPFVMRWPGVLPAGTVYEQPVSSLDVTATAAAIAGVPDDQRQQLDGVDLVPFLTGQREGPPHEHLFWRSGVQWAVRDAAGLKQLQTADSPIPERAKEEGPPQLVDLEATLDESATVSNEAAAARLRAAYDAWNAGNEPPRFDGFRTYNAALKSYRHEQVRETAETRRSQ